MTTLGDLVADLRSHVDEQDPTFWQPDEIVRWINEGVREIARRTEVLQRWRSYNTVQGQAEYPAPEDMLRIYRVEYRLATNDVRALEFVPFANMDHFWFQDRAAQGTPVAWTMWGYPGTQDTNQIHLFPVPSTSLADGMRIQYYALPRVMITDEDPADLPAGWEDLVTLYVEYVARRKEAQDNRWREAYELFEQRLREMQRTTQHWSDQEQFMADRYAWSFGVSSDWEV